mmetsp:Transcript_798/g.2240  ORF Transcript_798/g.2240 Transcript_798/m.2240 type:complete len:318 (+) Transcript_798:1707-2660(+)
MDLLLQVLGGLLERLLLRRQGLQLGLEVGEARPALLHLLLGGVGGAAADAVLDEGKLVLLALELLLEGAVLGGGGAHALHLAPRARELDLVLLHLLLELRELLQPHQDVAALRRGAAGDGAGRIVQVAILGDGADPHVRVEGDLLRRLGRVAHEVAAEDVLHGTLHLLLEADDLERQVQVGSGGDRLGLPHDARGNRRVDDLVQRDDGDAAAQLTVLEQGLARLFAVHDHKEHAAARAHLKGAVVLREVGLDVEQFGDHALDLRAVEALERVRVVEVDATEVGPKVVQLPLQLLEVALGLLLGLRHLLVALGVELQL